MSAELISVQVPTLSKSKLDADDLVEFIRFLEETKKAINNLHTEVEALKVLVASYHP